MRNSTFIGILAIVVIAPIVAFAVWSMLYEVSDFFNPCITWGTGSANVTLNPAAGGPCATSAGAVSQTIPQAVTMLVLVQGGILFAAFLGAFGMIRNHSKITLVAAIVLLAESIPLVFDGWFIFTILPAGFFLWVNRTKQVEAQSPRNKPSIEI